MEIIFIWLLCQFLHFARKDTNRFFEARVPSGCTSADTPRPIKKDASPAHQKKKGFMLSFSRDCVPKDGQKVFLAELAMNINSWFWTMMRCASFLLDS